ncbi:MAG: hypothetical protein A3F12_07170 [Gammaproteobacteria bacterium RIFCSPHIGHO2_12_FULL_38_14]|nr:MAG: hypothetical protein A3F12_07170 [Gammaproteobacteria bacterium RIFCSPHIGHO2_12_FULL_38_14]
MLLKQHLKLATAESCTGGGLSFWITSIPGSSTWFERGFVTYSNESKIEILGVKTETLEKYGAVSRETAIEMAEGALKKSHANIALAITGIAGPDGGSKEKPVGTVWIALADSQSTVASCTVYQGDRNIIRNKTIEDSFQLLLQNIL